MSSGEDEDVEQFGLNAADLEFAFDPLSKRRRMTKKQALYGVFGGDEGSDDEDGFYRPRFGGSIAGKRSRKKDLTSGQDFVSGGLKRGSIPMSDQDGSVDQNGQATDSDDENDGDEPSLSNKKSSNENGREKVKADDDDDSGQLISSARSAYQKSRHRRAGFGDGAQSAAIRRYGRSAFGVDNDPEAGAWEKYTTGIGSRLLKKYGYEEGKGLGKDLQGISAPVQAFLRKGKGAIGYYGREKPQRLSQKANKSAEFADDGEKFRDDDDDLDELNSFKPQWQRSQISGKSGSTAKKGPRYRYRTLDDLLESGVTAEDIDTQLGVTGKMIDKLSVKTSKVKVIDMTSREQKVSIGYQSLVQKGRKRHDMAMASQAEVMRQQDQTRQALADQEVAFFDLPELRTSLDQLVASTEQEMLRCHRRLKLEQDSIVNARQEEQRLTEKSVDSEQQLRNLEEIFRVIDSLERSSMRTNIASSSSFQQGARDDPVSQQFLESLGRLRQLHKDFFAEFKMFGLHQVAEAVLLPLMKQMFTLNWKPRSTDTIEKQRYLYEIEQLQTALVTEELGSAGQLNPSNVSDEMSSRPQSEADRLSSYDKLLWNTFVLRLRQEITGGWQVRDPDWLVDLLERWRPLISPWMLDNLLSLLILPRLHNEVEVWNPVEDTQPLHQWLHPWLVLMNDKLEFVYPTIRQKLGEALQRWHPQDLSARSIIEPWRTVWQRQHLDSFLVKYIVPKLRLVLQQMDLNPINQDMAPWGWVSRWFDVVHPSAMVPVLDTVFFPRWLEALCRELDAGGPERHRLIAQWFQNWKEQIPAEFKEHPVIQVRLGQAVEIMRHALRVANNGQQSVDGPIMRYYHSMTGPTPASGHQAAYGPPNPHLPQPPFPPAPPPTHRRHVPESFKEMVEKRASELSIVFRPLRSRTWEAQQLYQFGSATIFFDRDTCFIQNSDGSSRPVSLSELVERAQT